MYIKDIFHSNTGSSQYRMEDRRVRTGKDFTIYGQTELEEDITGVVDINAERKTIRLREYRDPLLKGDLIFSTINGKATVIGPEHEGYIFTQNYVRMVPIHDPADLRYIAYLINENEYLRKQLEQNVQGSKVMRYSLNMLKNIKLPELPPREVQRIVGDIYYKQQRLTALKERVAQYEHQLTMALLKGAN